MASMCVRAPAPLGAAQVTGYKDCLADGGAVAIEFQSPGDLEASKMALLLGGFALASQTPSSLVATKLAPKKVAARRRRKAPQPVVLDGDDDDLVDEDALLAADGLEPPKVDEDAAKCAPRKPCENCSCGAKERLEAEGGGVRPPMPQDTSGCGNCGKGDAFRCAGCPSLGKPAFKADAGTKLVLDLTDDLGDEF
jgi:hypothetical protein